MPTRGLTTPPFGAPDHARLEEPALLSLVVRQLRATSCRVAYRFCDTTCRRCVSPYNHARRSSCSTHFLFSREWPKVLQSRARWRGAAPVILMTALALTCNGVAKRYRKLSPMQAPRRQPSCNAQFFRQWEWPRLLQGRARRQVRSACIGVKCHKWGEPDLLNHKGNVRAAPHDAE
jgi:hypothetical protein